MKHRETIENIAGDMTPHSPAARATARDLIACANAFERVLQVVSRLVAAVERLRGGTDIRGQPEEAALDVAYDVLDEEQIPRCRVCGCTENDACDGGCSWATPKRTLCSNCADALLTRLTGIDLIPAIALLSERRADLSDGDG
ncbi:MAG: hypothetical protein ACREEN_01650 [Stellaceae bacterium]